jgi:hypothetical protein
MFSDRSVLQDLTRTSQINFLTPTASFHHLSPQPSPKRRKNLPAHFVYLRNQGIQHPAHLAQTMVEPMNIDHNGVYGQATPDESVTESSVKGEDTPESTDVTRHHTPPHTHC